MTRACRIPRLLLLTALAPIAGCELVIGDISLPPARLEGTDALPRDAHVEPDGPRNDAAVVTPDGASPPADSAVPPPPVDAKLPSDAAVLPPDAAKPPPPDAYVPPPADAYVPPPPDALVVPDAAPLPPGALRPYAGTWFIYGMSVGANGFTSLQAVLNIQADRAELRDTDGQVLDPNVSLRPDANWSGTLTLRTPLDGRLLRGALAPSTGFGVFSMVPDAAHPVDARFFLLVRAAAAPNQQPPNVTEYALLGAHPELGDGEIGGLFLGARGTYTRQGRLPFPPQGGPLDDLQVDWSWQDQWHLVLNEPNLGETMVLTPTQAGGGMAGLDYVMGSPTGLFLAWDGRMPNPDLAVGPLFCGGLAMGEAGTVMNIQTGARVNADGSLEWDDGNVSRLTWVSTGDGNDGGFHTLNDGRNPFGSDQALALSDAEGEVLLVLPVDSLGNLLVWGAFVCVRTDLVSVF